MTAKELAHDVGRAISDATDDILAMHWPGITPTADVRMVIASRLWEFGIHFSLLMDIRPFSGDSSSDNGDGKHAGN